ncbi:transcription termination factor Rho [Pedococcus sp.]|uniref:transcription termination factor Rho n=1 Tax=Pedococcus sp. TaxID=2860345 RepID=UPI002E136102|nr:transcription termination factor Rho [Pedococcus sp.]
MTDTTTLDAAASQDAAEKPRRSGALTAMKVAELQGLAASMGITGTAKMRKGDLVTAIKARQSGTTTSTSTPAAGADSGSANGAASPAAREERPAEARGTTEPPRRQGRDAGERQGRGAGERQQDRGDQNRGERQQDRGERQQDRGDQNRGQQDRGDQNRGQQDRGERQQDRGERQQDRGDQSRGEQNRDRDERQQDRGEQNQNRGQQERGDQNRGFDDDADGRGGRRRNRNRSRNRDRDKRGPRQHGDFGGDYDNEPQVAEDDVLIPVAGILDVLDNYAFVRTSGYLAGANDVYVPLGMVKKNGMRKGDAVTGAVRAQREDQQQNQRQKFNALVRLDTINGMGPDEARKRVEFGKLTPLYPQQRLRLETEPNILTTRVIDLVAPIGKGQRGLIVAPAKAGKTMVMQAIANAITTNNPECHLMVVLVDERPEEVTDMQRAVKGEVISSTFDRPAEDHTTVAELAIERAKRLVEMGHDVVVLLDSITKLGRAYNLSAPASGRILSGGVDSAALYPPKKFFGAARNIENGGSLTILATALVETGSRMDEVIFEEFKGTGNMELKLDRGLANRRIFPAVDVNNSGTRKEEILLSGDELKIMWKLRRVLAALDQQQGIELLIDRVRKTKSNVEFLMQIQQTSSVKLTDEVDD